MKNLLIAIRDYLRNDTDLNYVQDRSIFITFDEYWLPDSIAFPAISIKDGSIKNDQRLCKNYLQEMFVIINVWQQALRDPEQLVIGDNSILDMAETVKALLIDRKFSLEGLMNVFITDEGDSENFKEKNGSQYIQKKSIIVKYSWHKTWD
jgi:hypothetical protein